MKDGLRMICPKCKAEMETGELRLHSGWLCRLIFAPENSPLPSLFTSLAYKDPTEGQHEIKFKDVLDRRGWATHFVKDDTYSCHNCGVTIIAGV